MYIDAFDAGFVFVKCGKRGTLNVGAATCRPPRFEYNLWGWMVPPDTWYKSFPRGKLARLGEPDEGRGVA